VAVTEGGARLATGGQNRKTTGIESFGESWPLSGVSRAESFGSFWMRGLTVFTTLMLGTIGWYFVINVIRKINFSSMLFIKVHHA
jgi:hypothetical protein